MDSDDVVTQADVEHLNRAAIERAAAIVRLTGSMLVVVGVLGTLGWLWVMVRSQTQATPVGFFFDDDGSADPDLVERFDAFANTLTYLLFAGFVLGLGVLARLAADVAQSWAGGSITGFAVGDRLPDDADTGE